MSNENGNGNQHRNGNSPYGQVNGNGNSSGHQRNGHVPPNGVARNGTGNHNDNGRHGADSIPAHDLLWDSLPTGRHRQAGPATGRQPGLPAQGPGQPVGQLPGGAHRHRPGQPASSGMGAGATRSSAMSSSGTWTR